MSQGAAEAAAVASLMVFILKFTTSESDEQLILITSGGVCMCVGVGGALCVCECHDFPRHLSQLYQPSCHMFRNRCVSIASCAVPAPTNRKHQQLALCGAPVGPISCTCGCTCLGNAWSQLWMSCWHQIMVLWIMNVVMVKCWKRSVL